MRARLSAALGATQLAALLALALLPGCCCDTGPDRLLSVAYTWDPDERGVDLAWAAAPVDVPPDTLFSVSYYGDSDGELIELYDDLSGQRIGLGTEKIGNAFGCALVEAYVPNAILAGGPYSIVHRASASPGDFADTGDEPGDSMALLESFQGEPALVAHVFVAEGGSGGSGGDTGGTGGAGGAPTPAGGSGGALPGGAGGGGGALPGGAGGSGGALAGGAGGAG
jgi:hypothetical protein